MRILEINKIMMPICVDLDGTLISEDITVISVKKFLTQSLWNIFKIMVWYFYGMPYLKKRVAQQINVDVSELTYNRKLLEFLKKKKVEGHKIFLATASDEILANKLMTIFGEKGFIYAGNSIHDVPVWRKAAESILVNPDADAVAMMKGHEYKLLEDLFDEK